MRKTLYAAGFGAAGLLMAGCVTTPPVSEAPSETTGDTAATVEETATAADTTDSGAATPVEAAEQTVARRGRERWDFIAEGDYYRAYAYLSPGYRDKITHNEYIVKLAGQRVRWNGADFEKVECEPEICRATWVIHWSYKIPGRGAGTHVGEKRTAERWILADGEWYFVPTV